MTRRLARIALVAALMVGVVAMHSFGHRGHSEASEPSEGEAAVLHHHMAHGSGGHDMPSEQGSDQEDDPLTALSMLGFMICGGVMLRVAFEVLRRALPKLLEAIATIPAAPVFRALRTHFRHPPPLLRPTSLLLNRIAVLRI